MLRSLLLGLALCVAPSLGRELGVNINTDFQANRLSDADAARLLKKAIPGVNYAKMFTTDLGLLSALAGVGISHVVVSVPNVDLASLAAADLTYANSVADKLAPFVANGMQLTIAVGNEPLLAAYNGQFRSVLVPALSNMQAALHAKGLDSIRLTVPFDPAFLAVSYPPQNGIFTDDDKAIVLGAASIIRKQNSPFFVNLYPYFAYNPASTDVPLDFALLKTSHTVDGVTYPNMLAAQVAAVRAALLAADPTLTEAVLPIVIGETGWPTAGSDYATVDNAKTFVTNAINSGISMYLFEAYDELNKAGGSGSSGTSSSTSSGSGGQASVEGSWGLMYEDGTQKFAIVWPTDLTCDTYTTWDGVKVTCPDQTMENWISTGLCVEDPSCGVVKCPGVPKTQMLATCTNVF